MSDAGQVSASTEDELVTVASFRDLTEALIAKGQLDAAGIECFLADDNIVRMDWFWSNLMGGVKLNVPASQADAAVALLNGEGETLADEMAAPVCPKCGSSQIGIVDPDKGVRLGALWLLGLPTPRISPVQWKCGECGAAWVEDDEEEPAPSQSESQ